MESPSGKKSSLKIASSQATILLKQISNSTPLSYYTRSGFSFSSSFHSWAHFFVLLQCWDVLSMFKVSLFQLSLSNWPPPGLFTTKVTLKY